jgi:hypothetical protein
MLNHIRVCVQCPEVTCKRLILELLLGYMKSKSKVQLRSHDVARPCAYNSAAVPNFKRREALLEGMGALQRL